MRLFNLFDSRLFFHGNRSLLLEPEFGRRRLCDGQFGYIRKISPSLLYQYGFGISLPGNVFHRLVNGNPVPPVTFHALLRVPSHFTRTRTGDFSFNRRC